MTGSTIANKLDECKPLWSAWNSPHPLEAVNGLNGSVDDSFFSNSANDSYSIPRSVSSNNAELPSMDSEEQINYLVIFKGTKNSIWSIE
jgi:hypothetical protein